MNPPKCSEEDYINFVIATPRQVTATEAERVQPKATSSGTRCFHQTFEPAGTGCRNALEEASSQFSLSQGILVIDDSTLDKPYSQDITCHRHCSGKHDAVVSGINLITLLWTDGDREVPWTIGSLIRIRIENEERSFSRMVKEARQRDFQPRW